MDIPTLVDNPGRENNPVQRNICDSADKPGHKDNLVTLNNFSLGHRPSTENNGKIEDNTGRVGKSSRGNNRGFWDNHGFVDDRNVLDAHGFVGFADNSRLEAGFLDAQCDNYTRKRAPLVNSASTRFQQHNRCSRAPLRDIDVNNQNHWQRSISVPHPQNFLSVSL